VLVSSISLYIFKTFLVRQSIKSTKHDLVHLAGPISGPSEAEFILKRTKGVHGFYGASSMERLPVEQAITTTVQLYKSISIE
jgi:predicted TIM-barrel enzyme